MSIRASSTYRLSCDFSPPDEVIDNKIVPACRSVMAMSMEDAQKQAQAMGWETVEAEPGQLGANKHRCPGCQVRDKR